MKKSKFFLFLLGAISCMLEDTYAQIKDPATLVPSANEMNLGFFGEIPVSFNSGLPDISIPLYALHANTINVPITLSYHASGVKPDIHPSWVGLGWSLIAGGSINRKMNYTTDEWDVPNSNLNDRGYYFSHSRNSISDWSSTTQLKNTNVDNLTYDSAPDEFSFSFPGHSGKFFLDDAGNWQVQSDKPVKVKFDANDFIEPFPMNTIPYYADHMSTTFNKFTLIDESGIQYVFGESSAIEYSDDILVNPEEGKKFIASCWRLKRIISADGVDVVECNYERGPFQSFLYQAINNKSINGYPHGRLDPQCASFYYGLDRNGMLMSPVYLKSIEYQRGGVEINFTTTKSNELNYTDEDYINVIRDRYGPTASAMEYYSDVLDYYTGIPYFQSNPFPFVRYYRFIWLKLDKIDIVNLGSNATIRSVNFNYNNISTERLKLLNVNFRDQANDNIQTYSFNYQP